jgi:hypothetical protein
MKIPFGQTIDQLEFFEFLWLYERLAKQKEKEAQNINSNGNQNLKTNQKDMAEEMMRSEGLM